MCANPNAHTDEWLQSERRGFQIALFKSLLTRVSERHQRELPD
jgi:hypothetical protein